LRRGDGFVAQLISFMYDKTFLYHFGRVKTLVWMRSPGWEFLVAHPGHSDRKKMTVMREMSCDIRVIAKTERTIRPGERRKREHGWDVTELQLDNGTDVIELERTDFYPDVSSYWI